MQTFTQIRTDDGLYFEDEGGPGRIEVEHTEPNEVALHIHREGVPTTENPVLTFYLDAVGAAVLSKRLLTWARESVPGSPESREGSD